MPRGFRLPIALVLLAASAFHLAAADREEIIKGIVRRIDESRVFIEGDTGTMSTIAISHSTKYMNTSGGATKIGEFQPGDHVSIDATEDRNRQYHASVMKLVKEGTPDEHSAASMATGDVTHPIVAKVAAADAPKVDSAPAGSSGSGGGEPPRLRRAGASDAGSGNSNSAPSPVASSTPSSGSAPGSATIARPPAPREARDPDAPVLRRAPGSSSSDSSPSNSSPTSTARPASTDAPVVAARPSLHAEDENGTTRPPTLPQASAGNASGPRSGAVSGGDDFIEQTREAAFEFSESLPNYIVKQYTTRYESAQSRGQRTSWHALDNVTADVIEENGEEKYKNILVNGKPPAQDPEKTGSWSKGEYSSLMQDVLSPITAADFHGKRTTTIANHAAVRYDFSVEQPNSHWHIEAEGQSYLPAYEGTIWIDKENHRVLRIELSALNLPRTFPLDTVESAVDYDYVSIGEGRFLLPVHSEALSCSRGSGDCSRNVIEFRNYRKFESDSSITFDPN